MALELFSARGLDGASLQQIADRIGISKAALYHHFKSKDEILQELLAPSIDRIEQLLDRYENEPDTPARVRSFFNAYLDHQLAHRRMVAFVVREPTILAHPAVAKRTQASQRRLERLLAGDDLDLADQIRVTIALGGISHAVVMYGDTVDEPLRHALRDAAAILPKRRTQRRSNVG